MRGNLNALMKQVKEMQEKVLKIQEELATKTIEATVGGGMVTVVANGQGDIVEIKIEPEAVDPDDVEMLQDLILAAVNEASRKAKDLMADEMSKVTGGMRIPGLF
jgi:DNA-binding YbaB/EbfC family protein